MRMINAKYRVSDCEHRGDINNAISEIRNIRGCKVTDSYWDGNDCGEAYVEFTFSSDVFPMVYNELSGNRVYYDDDINKYVKIPDEKGILSNVERISFKEFCKTCCDVENDISVLINGKIYVNLMFEKNDYGTEIIEYAIDTLGKDNTTIKCYSIHIVDNCQFYNILLLTDLYSLTNYKAGLINGNHGWLKNHNVYGTFNAITSLSYYTYGFDELIGMMDIISNKKNLWYRYGYYGKEIEITYNDYMDGNTINTNIVIDNKPYKLLCYFMQVKKRK